MEKKAVSRIMSTLLLSSMLILAFSIQMARASGTIYIKPDGSVEGTDKIQRDGDVYTFTDNIYDSIVVDKDNIIVDGNNYTLEGTGSGSGFQLFGRNNVTIRNVRITQFYTGIFLSSSNGNTITSNVLTSNTQGINLGWSQSNIISSNTVTSNMGGIIVYQGSENVTVRDNTVASNTFGIDLGMANYCRITNNSLTNNVFGIELDHSSNNKLSGNRITSTFYFGIWLLDSNSNTVTDNNVADTINGTGIMMGDCTGNRIFHNNFVNNSIGQAYVYDSYETVWDDGYPSGGNYWSDYSGVDLYGGPNQDFPSGSDGLGDSPYVIDENNRDNYPLASPWVERTVGVKVGDWAKYQYEFTWSSTDPNEQPPQDLVDFVTRLDWYGINVLDVFDTTIEFQTVIHFKDGTETISQWTVDINNGSGNGTYLIAFIAAGLNPNEALCTFPPQFTWCNWKIEETISRPYVGVMRETNHLDVTNWSFIGRDLPLEFDSVDDFYWDRATGILCEHLHEQTFEEEGYTTSLSLTVKMIGTNIWKPSTVSATLDIDPETLNLKSKGKWITAYIQLPEGFNAADIDASTILLNGTLTPILDPKYGFVTNSNEYLVDHNNDGILERMVKFDRTAVLSWIYQTQGMQHGEVRLTITGELFDGTHFEGTDTVNAFWFNQRAPSKR